MIVPDKEKHLYPDEFLRMIAGQNAQVIRQTRKRILSLDEPRPEPYANPFHKVGEFYDGIRKMERMIVDEPWGFSPREFAKDQIRLQRWRGKSGGADYRMSLYFDDIYPTAAEIEAERERRGAKYLPIIRQDDAILDYLLDSIRLEDKESIIHFAKTLHLISTSCPEEYEEVEREFDMAPVKMADPIVLTAMDTMEFQEKVSE